MSGLATLTTEQARNAPAGPATDALVAEAMGWAECFVVTDHGDPHAVGHQRDGFVNFCPRYTTDIRAAKEATDWLAKETGWRLKLDIGADKTFARWTGDGCPWRDENEVAVPTAEPLARCRAVLLAAVMKHTKDPKPLTGEQKNGESEND